jgi:hypothetical protein
MFGLPLAAMVDTGEQSTIILRETLHDIVCHLRKSGQEVPPLQLPTVRLYGKDGQTGGKELCVTTQVSVLITVKGRSVSVPAFVQPDSEQACLLGMNALPLLGIQVLHHDGEPILALDHNAGESPSVDDPRLQDVVAKVKSYHICIFILPERPCCPSRALRA